MLADALVRLAGDASLRSAMGRASATLFNKNFRAEVMAEKVENVYMTAMAQGRP
jgi:glycosyltransferase involved in cell wall biosynthesis